MNPLLPILEELMDAPDHAGRAAWLLACPFNILITYQATIRNRLLCTYFAEGVAYLEFEISIGRSRRECGLIVQDNPLRMRMVEAAGFVPTAE
jgi:hypothetical protein